jgi:hypothetical protein
MIRVFLPAVIAASLLISNSNASPLLLPERTLPTSGGGKIEHVVATVREGDKSLIFMKVATRVSVASDQQIVPIAELQNRGLVDDQIRAGTYTIIARAAPCAGTKDCSSYYCNTGTCVSGTDGCECK